MKNTHGKIVANGYTRETEERLEKYWAENGRVDGQGDVE